MSRAAVANKSLPMRGLKLHEYQAGKLLHKFKIPIPLGSVAFNGKEAYLVAKQFTKMNS
jgi:succinyl-CoA synthetase beta subunit